jgi:hypothetical protein
VDLDGDGAGDACDADDDGDGISDAVESRLGTDPRKPDSDSVRRSEEATGPAKVAIRAAKRAKRAALARGLAVTVTPDQAVALRISLVVRTRTGAITLVEKVLPRAPGARRSVLKPRLSALRGVKRVEVRVLAINASGLTSTAKKAVLVL